MQQFPFPKPIVKGVGAFTPPTQGITTKAARQVLGELLDGAESGVPVTTERIDQIIDAKGLRIPPPEVLAECVASVVKENPDAVADVRSGRTQAVNVLVGKVLAILRGAEPTAVRSAILESI
jgi:Asp-tRNA(Asn)/Glu-tRNA(Gln) amidotransferase B subunit